VHHLKEGDVCLLLPNPATGDGGKVYFAASVTRVKAVTVEPPNYLVEALNGRTEYVNGACYGGLTTRQWVSPLYLVPLGAYEDDRTESVKMELMGPGTEYELKVAQVITNLEERRTALGEAHGTLIAEAVTALNRAINYPARLADHLTLQADLLRSGEAVVDWVSGTLIWKDLNRDDPFPTLEVGPSVEEAESWLKTMTERRDQALAAQDENLAFLRAIGTPTVRVDRDTYEDWFVDLP